MGKLWRFVVEVSVVVPLHFVTKGALRPRNTFLSCLFLVVFERKILYFGYGNKWEFFRGAPSCRVRFYSMFMCKYVLGFIMFFFLLKVDEFVLFEWLYCTKYRLGFNVIDIVKELYFLQRIIFHLLEKQFCSILLIQTYLSFSNPILPRIHFVKEIVHFSIHFIIYIIH